MATLQHVDIRQIDELLREAAARQVPVTVTLCVGSGWRNCRGRLVGMQAGRLLVEAAVDSTEGTAPASKVGVSFKLKHHKHVFTATAAGSEPHRTTDGEDARLLHLCVPSTMHRMQRRAFQRCPVPENRVVRVSFWGGGRENEPEGDDPGCPIWCGRVADLSAGGFQAACDDDSVTQLLVGESVGVRLVFGAAEEIVYGDAQFRHIEQTDTGEYLVGFQFVGLAQTPEGRRTLQLIGTRVAQFQRENNGT